MNQETNVDRKTVEGFGDEWERFDQSELPEQEQRTIFESYFSVFPWHRLPMNAEGFDLGCGSGRWAKLVAPRVTRLHCIDPSVALNVARKNLAQFTNCTFHSAAVDGIPIKDGSMDFGYSLGVLHHVPDTQAGIEACVKKLKPGAPFLVYLYYAFDNRPWWFRAIWRLSDVLRAMVSRFPHGLRYFSSQVLAFLVYFPLARLSWVFEKTGLNVSDLPLSAYRNLSFYTMRTDALDRFGTRLEQRFSREQIRLMMEESGLEQIVFSENEPFWCAVGYRSLNDRSN
jgi:SAM-dependent methyltransferase